MDMYDSCRHLARYKTLIFDCDGVILDSNRVKTDAFLAAALPYGKAAADALVAHHIAHGGVSRYAKFRHFLTHIVPVYSVENRGPGFDELVESYAANVFDGLMQCPVAAKMDCLREQTCESIWLIVSGGDQTELRKIFAKRGIEKLFDGGIFGSPDTKDEILNRELARERIHHPALFLGDSVLDHKVAARNEIDFTFVSGWTEVPNWEIYVEKQRLASITAVGDLVRER